MALFGKIIRWVLDVGAFVVVAICLLAYLGGPYAWGLLIVAGAACGFIALTNPWLAGRMGLSERTALRNGLAGLLVIPAFAGMFLAATQFGEHDFLVANGVSMAEYNLAVDQYNADSDRYPANQPVSPEVFKDTCGKKVALACLRYASSLMAANRYQEAFAVASSICRPDFDTVDGDGPMMLDKEDSANACFKAGRSAGKLGNADLAVQNYRLACESHSPAVIALPACAELGRLLTEVGGERDVKEGVIFLRRACDGKNLVACHNLAMQYASGVGVEYDKNYAVELADRACQNLGNYETADIPEADAIKSSCELRDLIRKSIKQCDRIAGSLNCTYNVAN